MTRDTLASISPGFRADSTGIPPGMTLKTPVITGLNGTEVHAVSASEKTDPRILAGEFVLADADGDAAKAQAVLARVGAGEVTTVDFITSLARLAAEMLQAVAGDRWRDDLRTALLALDVQGVSDGLGSD